MALLGEVLGTADDVVTAVFDGRDKGSTLGIGNQLHPITDSDGIGAADALQTEVTLHLRLNQLASGGSYPSP